MALLGLDEFTAAFLGSPAANPPSSPSQEAAPTASQVRCSTVAQEALALSHPTQPEGAQSSWQKTREKRYFHAIALLRKTEIRTLANESKAISALSGIEINALPIKPKLKNFLNYLNQLTKGSIKEFRTVFYPKVLEVMRALTQEILLSPGASPRDEEIMQALCYTHFMVDLGATDSGRAFVRELTAGSDAKDLLDASVLDKKLRASLRHDSEGVSVSDLVQHKLLGSDIKWTDRIRKLAANLPIATWDPATYSLRSFLRDIDIGGGEVVHLLRMACPVKGNCGNPEVDPLFLGYLKSLLPGEKHLYMNNISNNPDTDVRRHSWKLSTQSRLEHQRAELLKGIAQSPEYRDQFLFISLPHDSDFYEQVGTSPDLKSTVFIQTFLQHLEHNTQGFYLPESDQKPRLLEKLAHEFEKLWDQCFFKKSTLNLQERKEFINMAYALISTVVMKEYQVTHANNTCKDGVDRAMGSTAALVAYLDPAVSEEELVYILSMPAVTHHARAPQLDRTERSTAAVRRFLHSRGDLA